MSYRSELRFCGAPCTATSDPTIREKKTDWQEIQLEASLIELSSQVSSVREIRHSTGH